MSLLQIAWHQAKKEMCERWALLIVFALIVATYLVLCGTELREPWSRGPYDSSESRTLVTMATYLFAALIALVATQSDNPVSHRAWYPTRPLGWKGVLLGKLLFVMLYLLLPSVIADGALIVLTGETQRLGIGLLQSLAFRSAILFSFATCGALSSNFVGSILVGMGAFIAYWIPAAINIEHDYSFLEKLFWSNVLLRGSTWMALASLGILIYIFGSRRVFVSCAGVAAAAFALVAIVFGGAAFDVKAKDRNSTPAIVVTNPSRYPGTNSGAGTRDVVGTVSPRKPSNGVVWVPLRYSISTDSESYLDSGNIFFGFSDRYVWGKIPGFYNQEYFNDVRLVQGLDNEKLKERESNFMRLFGWSDGGALPMEFNIPAKIGTYTAGFTHKIVAEIPLKAGQSWREGGDRVEIRRVTLSQGRLQFRIDEAATTLYADRSQRFVDRFDAWDYFIVNQTAGVAVPVSQGQRRWVRQQWPGSPQAIGQLTFGFSLAGTFNEIPREELPAWVRSATLRIVRREYAGGGWSEQEIELANKN